MRTLIGASSDNGTWNLRMSHCCEEILKEKKKEKSLSHQTLVFGFFRSFEGLEHYRHL